MKTKAMQEQVIGKIIKLEGRYGVETLSDLFAIPTRETEGWGCNELGLICSFYIDKDGEMLDETLGLTGIKAPLTETLIHELLDSWA
jgi:hypothetical protein